MVGNGWTDGWMDGWMTLRVEEGSVEAITSLKPYRHAFIIQMMIMMLMSARIHWTLDWLV